MAFVHKGTLLKSIVQKDVSMSHGLRSDYNKGEIIYIFLVCRDIAWK